MTEEEYRREREEAAYLTSQINSAISELNRLNEENSELNSSLITAVENMKAVMNSFHAVGGELTQTMGMLSDEVGYADVTTKEVSQALNELALQYSSFKSLSSASKNLTGYNDEYFTRYSYYNELRRITLGYVIGLDTNIISSENARKKVEKAYLQNTDYWLAYCISAVMLWANDEKEAAQRSMAKSLSINYFNACLFYLLINLRFNRIEAAKKWYVNFLDKADANNLGDEWQYLLQAYLFGVFGANGSDQQFQEIVSNSLKNMLYQVEVATVDFAKSFSDRACTFCELFVHKTGNEYTLLSRNCSEYDDMKNLLTAAEKNAKIAQYYDSITELSSSDDEQKLPQRIENVLYSLISDYDDDELELVRKIKYNEAIINAKGDDKIAKANYDAMTENLGKKKNMGDLLMDWAFADDTSQVDVTVRRFAISLMREPIKKGLAQFSENYRSLEQEKYTFDIEGCELICNENDYNQAEQTLDKYYENNKWHDVTKDKQVKIYTAMCGGALLLFLILFIFFSPVILTFGILVGLAGSFLLWRRIVDIFKILREKKRKAKLLLKKTLAELADWRTAFKEADSKSSDLLAAIDKI